LQFAEIEKGPANNAPCELIRRPYQYSISLLVEVHSGLAYIQVEKDGGGPRVTPEVARVATLADTIKHAPVAPPPPCGCLSSSLDVRRMARKAADRTPGASCVD
jgi:hypothetical protein